MITLPITTPKAAKHVNGPPTSLASKGHNYGEWSPPIKYSGLELEVQPNLWTHHVVDLLLECG